jgi:Fe-S oxidoreductase
MITLTGMNVFYVAGGGTAGSYPFAEWLAVHLTLPADRGRWITGYHACWWIHLVTIFFFANYLPYSKHFHVYLSLPNVFLARPWPMGKVPDMPEVTEEVKAMMTGAAAEPAAEPGRFGILDVEDVTRKNYLEALTCTQCGRCTDVCPVNITGGPLSPRKAMMATRQRMEEKGPSLVKGEEDDGKTLNGMYVTGEEILACTMCNACVQECPLTINQPELILGMRRYKVLEEGAAPPEWNSVYANIENNGALWKMPATDRMRWAGELKIVRDGKEEKVSVPVMAEMTAAGKVPEYLLWTGSAGAFDSRYRRVLQDFVRILAYLKIDFAVLGEEELSSGDFARRTGNEMLFVMQAMQNMEIFKGYGVTKILTCDPHAYNTFKNEYPSFGGMPAVIHHSQFLEEMIRTGRLVLPERRQERRTVTYHDPCYLGRINGEYEAPRRVLRALGLAVEEMPRNRATALCCGGGGGQMFREKKSAGEEIFVERAREALATGAATVVTACPYCMTMLTDGLKYEHAEEKMVNKDLAELVAGALGLQP